MYDHVLNEDQKASTVFEGIHCHKTMDPRTITPTSNGIGSWMRLDLEGKDHASMSRVRIQRLGDGEGSSLDMDMSAIELEAVAAMFGAMAKSKRAHEDLAVEDVPPVEDPELETLPSPFSTDQNESTDLPTGYVQGYPEEEKW